MSTDTTATPVTHAVPTAPATPAAPAAPAAPMATATDTATPTAPTEKTFTQADVDAIVRERLARAADKPAEPDTATLERIAALETLATNAEKAAVTAIAAKAAVNAVSVEQVIALTNLESLTSSDAAAIETKIAEFLTANPHFVKAGVAGPDLRPAPGVTAAGSDRKLLTEAELDAIDPAELAADEEKFALYLASRAALREAGMS